MFKFLRRAAALPILIFALICSAQAQNLPEAERYRLAADYSASFRGLSVLVIKGDKIVFEEYQNGFAAEDAQMLASGTKSFAGVMAAAAQEDGLLRLDEKVADTITEWRADAQKSKITIRQLLNLTSGIGAGGGGLGPAPYAESLNTPVAFDPGTTFQYGPAPFQIFGEVMRRKLKTETPLDYLKRRILNPIGLSVASWTHQRGQPNIPSGAFLTAREWAKFGLLLKNGGAWQGRQIVSRKLLEECFVGTKTNPNYGLTFWLNRAQDETANVAAGGLFAGRRMQTAGGAEPEATRISKRGVGADLPKDLYMAAGLGKQRLYVIPSLDLVVVRQGRQSRFDDAEFLRRLLYGRAGNQNSAAK